SCRGAALSVDRRPLPTATVCATVRRNSRPKKAVGAPFSAKDRVMPGPWRLPRRTLPAGSPYRAAAALVCGVTAALLVTMTVPAAADDPVVARVNGAEIRASDVAVAEEDIGSNLSQMPPGNRRDYVITYLADMMLVAKAAEDRKIADSDDFKR